MTLSRQQRVLVAIGAAGGACAIAVPAALALSHNPTFGQRIPVRVPSSAHVARFDSHGSVVAAAHHRSDDPTPHRHGHPITSTVASSHEPEPGDDRGRGNEPGDDRGRGNEPGDDRTSPAPSSSNEPEPSDDRTTPAPSSSEPEPGDDHGGNRGPGNGSSSSNRGPGNGSGSSSDNRGPGNGSTSTDNRGPGGGDDGGRGDGDDDNGHHDGGDH